MHQLDVLTLNRFKLYHPLFCFFLCRETTDRYFSEGPLRVSWEHPFIKGINGTLKSLVPCKPKIRVHCTYQNVNLAYERQSQNVGKSSHLYLSIISICLHHNKYQIADNFKYKQTFHVEMMKYSIYFLFLE